MPSIRHHTKSRHGCSQCKQKKVKCDELRPKCRRCVSKGLPCSLMLLFGDEDERPPLLAGTSAFQIIANSTAAKPPDDGSFSVNSDDLQWYHHFIVNTASTLALDKNTIQVWTQDIPLLASNSPSLFHCICALAALHKLSITSDVAKRNECIAIATSHQSQALTLYILILKDASVKTSTLLVSFNLIFQILPYAWRARTGFFVDPGARDITYAPPTTAISVFLETVKYWQGTTTIVNQYLPFIQTSPVAPLFLVPDLSSLPPLPSDAQSFFDILSMQITEQPAERTNLLELEVCRLYRSVRCSMKDQWRAYMWSFVTEMSPAFVESLERRESFALVVLSGWTVCLESMQGVWWTSGWPRVLLSEISGALGPEWDGILAWPRSLISSTDNESA